MSGYSSCTGAASLSSAQSVARHRLTPLRERQARRARRHAKYGDGGGRPTGPAAAAAWRRAWPAAAGPALPRRAAGCAPDGQRSRPRLHDSGKCAANIRVRRLLAHLRRGHASEPESKRASLPLCKAVSQRSSGDGVRGLRPSTATAWCRRRSTSLGAAAASHPRLLCPSAAARMRSRPRRPLF